VKAYLILENGAVFEGESFGAAGEASGEVVFTTGMHGYLETLTDPSYSGHIVVQTFPLIGNYGVIPADFEAGFIGAKAYIVKYPCQTPSNFRSDGVLGTFLCERGVVGLAGIDTRQLTKILRDNGVMNGKIMMTPPTPADAPAPGTIKNAVAGVSGKEPTVVGNGDLDLVLLDYGAKKSIAEKLASRGARVQVLPYNTPADKILAMSPKGIMLSNGPGDPSEDANAPLVETIKTLMESNIPIFGICLGHQLMALAQGYKTRKMKFGHRGSNQPVKDLASGRFFITSQNHGYEVATEPNDPRLSFVNVNDKTCEGLDFGRHFSVQFHPEACGGPLDTEFLFDKFIERVKAYAAE